MSYASWTPGILQQAGLQMSAATTRTWGQTPQMWPNSQLVDAQQGTAKEASADAGPATLQQLGLLQCSNAQHQPFSIPASNLQTLYQHSQQASMHTMQQANQQQLLSLTNVNGDLQDRQAHANQMSNLSYGPISSSTALQPGMQGLLNSHSYSITTPASVPTYCSLPMVGVQPSICPVTPYPGALPRASSGLLQQQLQQGQVPRYTAAYIVNAAATVAEGQDGWSPDPTAASNILKHTDSVANLAKRSSKQQGTAHGVIPGLTKAGAASKRYRERQRSMMDSMEAEVADKLQQLQLLEAENTKLKLCVGVLEATTAIEEDVMNFAKTQGLPKVMPAHAATPGLSQAHVQQGMGHNVSSSNAMRLTDIAASAAAEESNYQAQNQPLTGLASNSQAARGTSSSSTVAALVGDHGLIASADPNALTGSSSSNSTAPELAKRMTTGNMVHCWKQLLRSFSNEILHAQKQAEASQARHQLQERAAAAIYGKAGLPAAAAAVATTAPGAAGGTSAGNQQDSGSSESRQRLQDLSEKCWALLKMMSMLNPGVFYQVFGHNLETGQPMPYNDQHWRNVAALLALTEEQESYLKACAELYLPRIYQLHQERLALQRQLQASGMYCCSSTQLCELPQSGADSASDAGSALTHSATLASLAGNLEKERVLRVMLADYIWNHVLHSMQKAQAVIYSYPLFMDLHAIMWVICEDALAAREAAGLPPHFVFPHRHDLQGLIHQQYQQMQQLAAAAASAGTQP